MRTLLAGLICVLGSAIVGAQGPEPRGSVIEQYQRFERNKSIVMDLVESSIEASLQQDPLQRVDTANRLIGRLSSELQRAAQEQDAPRVMEMGRHLRTLLEEGIIPNISTARATINPQSNDEKRLFELRDRTLFGLRAIDFVLPEDASIGKYQEVRELVQGLMDAREQLGQAAKGPRELNGNRAMK